MLVDTIYWPHNAAQETFTKLQWNATRNTYFFAHHLWVIWAVLVSTWLFYTTLSQEGGSTELVWAPVHFRGWLALGWSMINSGGGGELSLLGFLSSISQAQVYYYGGGRIWREGRSKQSCLKPSFRTNTLSFFHIWLARGSHKISSVSISGK